MTEYEALKVLDKIPRDTNIYRLLVELSERAHHLVAELGEAAGGHQTDRNRLNFRKTDPISEAFREVLEKPEPPNE